MLRVANHERGYRCEQQEDLKAITPAIMGALQRKKSDADLREVNERLRLQSEELQAESEKLQKVNETLLESEEREISRFEELSVVMDSVPAAVWMTRDPQAVHITGNRLFYEWVRLPEGVNASKSAPEGEKPETFRMFKDGVEMLPKDMPVHVAVTGSEVRNFEFDLVYPDGRVRYVFGNASPLYDTQGNTRGAVAVYVDITERKMAEKALQESEEHFHTMVNTIPQLAWIAYPDGYIYWYNERWYSYTGTTPEQMEGWGWQSVHDPKVLPKVLEQWNASLATGQMFDMEYPLHGADGIFRPFITRILPLKDAA
jgi:PAS domain-containing protein